MRKLVEWKGGGGGGGGGGGREGEIERKETEIENRRTWLESHAVRAMRAEAKKERRMEKDIVKKGEGGGQFSMWKE